MERKLFKVQFSKDELPQWICPTCQKSVLQLVKDSFKFSETGLSTRAHGDEAWEPDWLSYVYSCQLKCSNDACQEVVMSVGKGGVDVRDAWDEHDLPTQEWREVFSPEYFCPHLQICEIPAGTPDSVRGELNQSFALLFASPSSALNHVRIAVENILTNLGVRRYDPVKGKRRFLSLHKRIGLLPPKYGSVMQHLYAIKWLGNAGSHSSPTTIDDVLDAYDIMEEALREVYGTQKKTAARLAKRINKTRGPKKAVS